jgi:hypothetical protein
MEDLGYSGREVAEARQPVEFHAEPSGGLREAGQADYELAAEPVQRVVGTGVAHWVEQQLGNTSCLLALTR